MACSRQAKDAPVSYVLRLKTPVDCDWPWNMGVVREEEPVLLSSSVESCGGSGVCPYKEGKGRKVERVDVL